MIRFVLAGAAAVFLAAHVICRETGKIEFSCYTVPVPGLPGELENLKIAHISDIHYPFYIQRRTLEKIIELVNGEHPDIVLLTGDLITTRKPERMDCPALLGNLASRYGSYAVLGNHDYCYGRRELMDRLKENGITVLRNEHISTGPGGSALQILGLDDPSTFRDDPGILLSNMPAVGFKILITHSPGGIRSVIAEDIPLILVGHTHGGQVRIPCIGAPYLPTRAMREYSGGWFSRGKSLIYVNSGLGFAGFPLRFLCPREVAFITLTGKGCGIREEKRVISSGV